MEFNSGNNIFSGNRSLVVLVVILITLATIILGVLYFLKKQKLGEETSGLANKNNLVQQEKTYSLKKLMELTSAPEKNPDIKPNPALTDFTTAPKENQDSVSFKTDFELMEKLTAPKK